MPAQILDKHAVSCDPDWSELFSEFLYWFVTIREEYSNPRARFILSSFSDYISSECSDLMFPQYIIIRL